MSIIPTNSELSNFFETYPLYKRFSYNIPEHLDGFPYIAIKMECKECRSEQTFNLTTDDFTESPEIESKPIKLTGIPTLNGSRNVLNVVIHSRFLCQYCKNFEYDFLIKINGNTNTLMKVGQFPPWDISISKILKKILGKYESIFKKGLINESHSYGIGAYAYYRRITENLIDQLLDLIPDLMSQEEKKKYLPKLNETKKTQVVEQKIELVMDLLPPVLRPPNYNPLRLLYKILSEGLHDKTDEECLEIAEELRNVLTFLINQIISHKDAQKEFTDSMKKVLDKKKVNRK